jgi:hypothetical protein
MTHKSNRRAFFGTLGAVAAALTLDPDEMRGAVHSRAANETWDTSWLDRLASAQYRVVFNTSEIAEGNVLGYVDEFFNDFHAAHGTTEQQTRPVVVFRRLGTPMAFNDSIWNRYGIGEDLKIKDPETGAFATRNIYWKPRDGATGWEAQYAIEPLHRRGMISLVCNVAMTNWARRTAQHFKRDPEAVQKEVRENLIPGAILVPSGIYALIRAQNAGCAFMPGT